MSFHKIAPVKKACKHLPAPKPAPKKKAGAKKPAAPKRRPVAPKG